MPSHGVRSVCCALCAIVQIINNGFIEELLVVMLAYGEAIRGYPMETEEVVQTRLALYDIHLRETSLNARARVSNTLQRRRARRYTRRRHLVHPSRIH